MDSFEEYRKQQTERTFIQGYIKGYKHGYEDFRMRVTVELWDFHKLIKKLDTELADSISIAIDKIEKMK
tara:strand:- start:2838 stop:3044 length:207 start_codon:yes stop_codon:yes gene_type:complete